MSERDTDDDIQHIAVIGMAGRFPGARDPEEFWRNIADGIESVTWLSDQDLLAAGVPERQFREPGYVRAATVLDGMEQFDAGLFGLTPMEAAILDPQHRMLLESTQALFDHAGYNPETLTATTGVYVGVGFPSYLVNNLLGRPELIEQVGMQRIFFATDKGFAPTRISHKFDLTGPSVGVDTACSTSLVAVHQACRALLGYECDLAVAGGASAILPSGVGYQYHEGGIHSPDGHCRAFDAAAGGTRFGSGVGLVLLKRLSEAVADGDHVLAVIRGSAVNNDGAAKAGFTAPSATGQAAVIADALAFADVEPDTVGYVEAHGTGTVIGDPIELAGLTRAFREQTDRRQYCAIGSLKTNVGHLDVAAGIAGLIKTVQALRHRGLPPSLHFEQPNPAIDFARSPFYVNTELRPWSAPDGAPRRAGVSSFGIGGTNAHVVLEEAPVRPASGPSRDEQLVVLSARSPQALDRLGAELADAFRAAGDTPLADLAFTLSTGRRAHPHRRAIVCRDHAEAIEALEGDRPSAALSHVAGADAPGVAFVFPGQGAQQVRMLAGLFADQPVFREVVDRCAEHAADRLGVDLRRVIWPDLADEERARERLDQTWLTQPALFTVTLALARLWMAWGVRPCVLIGHSLGEYVAATLAEVLRFEDALDLVIERARLMNEMPGGAMLAVSLDEQALLPLLGDCSLAAVNGPQQCVAAGPHPSIEELERRLSAQGVEHRRLRTSHAFHSSMLDPVVAPFEEQVARFDLRAPRIPVVSCLTGRVPAADELGDPGYWARQLRGTVRFADAVRTAAEQGADVFLEVGPGRTLTSMVRRSGVPAHRVIASARGAEDARTDAEALLEALGALHCAGVPVDWEEFWAGQQRHRVPLPGHPFERERHWIEPVPAAATPVGSEEPVASEKRVGQVRRWTPAPRPGPDGAAWQPGEWLIVADDELGQALTDRLEKEGESVVRVRRGAAFAAQDEGFALDPAHPEDVAALLGALRQRGRLPRHIVLECGHGTAGASAPAPGDELRLAGTWVEALLAGAEDDELQLALVAHGLHRITADDDPSPSSAALTGFCRAIAADHPELAVVCVDVDDRLAEAADGIVGELAGGVAETVVAFRAGTRHVECYEARSTDTAPSGRSFVLTGGPAEVPMLLARRLARQRRARLTLVERRPLPPEPQWSGWLDEGTGPGLALAAVSGAGTLPELGQREAELSAAERGLAEAAGAAWDRDTVGAVLNRLCGSHVYRTLRDGGVDLRAGVVHRRAAIAERMRIRPAFVKFLDFFLQVLHEDGVVRCEGDRVEVLLGPEQVELFDSAAANALLPGFEPTISFLDHCVRNFPAALSGDIDAVGVLFPNGDPTRLEQAFRTLLDASNYRVYADLLGRLLADLADSAPGRPLRVLEVGGGNGQLTRIVAAALRGREVEYCFTDLGGSFVRRARRWAAGCGFTALDCQVFDITRDPVEQGLQAHSFDAVIGFDVVHATPRIAQTVENLRGLISPGGLLGLVEAVVSLRWVELLWGLAEGWWLFEDEEVRTGSPLVPLDTWDRVLRERPFADVVSFPRDEAVRSATDYGLVLAQQPATLDSPGYRAHLARRAEAVLRTTRERIGAVRELEALGAEVMVVGADPTSQEQIARVLSHAAARFGCVDGIVHAPELPLDDTPPPWSAADLPALAAPHVAAARTLVRAAAEAGVPTLAFVSPARAVTGGTGALRPAIAGSVFDVFADDDRVTAVRWDADGDPALLEQAIGRPGAVVLAGEAPDLGPVADRRSRSPRGASGATEAAAADVEEEILVIFRQLFGTEDLGAHDDFYRLGGDSLLATQVIARIRRRFRVDLAVKALFDAPTVAGLAEKVRAAQSEDAHADIPLLRVPRTDAVPLSFGQQSLWLAEQFHGPSATYNIPGAVRLLGRLEIEPLRRALREVVGRHEVLRTTVHAVDGSPVQRIHEDVTVDLPVREVAEEEIEELAQEHARTVFDLERGPLIRVALLRVAEADHVLLVNIHHIVSDGWSLGVLVEELVRLYSAFVRGEGSPLAPLDHQYADFADWQRRWLDGELFDQQLAYWRRQLAGAPKLLGLPTDRPRPQTQRIRNAVHRFVVPPELADRLGGLGRDEGATLFMVLLAGFKVLLSRLARTTDVSVGTTNANRTRAVFEQMIGMFVNNLVLRTDLGGDPTFRELLARVRATSVDAYAHQDLPFLTLVDELRQERSAAHTPLFQVLFLLQKLNITLELPGITARTVEVDALHTKFDLTLFMEEQAQGIVGTFIYNAELFDAATIDRMATRLVRVLHDAAEAPDTRIGELRMENNDENGTRDMTERDSHSTRLQSLRSAKRRSVDVGRISPVRTGFLPGLPQAPLVLEPAEAGVDLAGWLRGNRDAVDAHLHKHGAVLLRGFHKGSVDRFEEAASAICPTLFPEYGDLPREGESTRVYKSTPYPDDRSILFHNESSHLHTWPMRQFFSCVVAAREGGETPIVDCRRVLASLRPELAEEFTRRGLRYVRNFIDAVDVSWSRFYGTEDRAEVERKCAEAGEGFSWLPDGTLRTWRRADAVLPHPRTGEAVFFNQLALHHPSCLDADTRQSLEALYGEAGLPRNVYWGDGSVIPDEVVAEVREVMDREALVFTWQEGDVLVTDNMLVAHARRPFVGPRKIVVALGDMMRADLPAPADR
ncbi:type I polyketide synthase [Saccharothrix sp. ST-888]|uniref:type I polyketide synthase n=1 Tax=Saccharothrix sp. ST-888 TaxID=1427391 RepID=UPI00069789FE|nr:type I polyketide synthase [Saccharothrix sp. ST-888]